MDTIVILTMDETDDPTIEVIGPFQDRDAAHAWIDSVDEGLKARKARWMITRLDKPFTL